MYEGGGKLLLKNFECPYTGIVISVKLKSNKITWEIRSFKIASVNFEGVYKHIPIYLAHSNFFLQSLQYAHEKI